MSMLALPPFLHRALHAWRESWRARRMLDVPDRHPHEREFLPIAEALRDTPPHPAPRWLLGCLLALAILTVLWAFLGRVDVVAVAEGKVLAVGRSKPIQTDSTAVVRRIHVHEGQRVRAGDLLVEFDARLTAAEVEKLQSLWRAARLDEARLRALLEGLDAGHAPDPAAPDDVPVERQAQWRSHVQAQHLELQAVLAQGASAVAERDAEIAAARASIQSLRESLPIHREMAADYERLLQGRYVARHAWLERQRVVLEQQQQLAAQQARLDQAVASRRQAQQQRERVAAEARRTLLDQHQEAAQRLAGLTQDLHKARQRDELTRLVAPVDGTVQQLAVAAPGAVVAATQPVLVIVPGDAPVEVEAFLANRDIGFVHAGQPAQLKVEAFDFTRYGMLAGQVTSVSSDAIVDPQRGPVYGVRIRIGGAATASQDKALALAPGMSVRAEIRTGRRRILDYFLSPLQRRLDESLRER